MDDREATVLSQEANSIRPRSAAALLIAILAGAGAAAATDQRYTGQFEKNEVTITYTRKCDASAASVTTVQPQQFSPTVSAPMDTQRMSCPWGSLSVVSMSFPPPPAAPDLALPDNRRPQTGFLLDSAMTAGAFVSATATLAKSGRPFGLATAGANIRCGNPSGSACPPQPPQAVQITSAGTYSVQTRYDMSAKEILVDPSRYLIDAAGFTQEFSSYYQTEVALGLAQDDAAFSAGVTGKEFIQANITIRTYFRYKALPVIDLGDVSRPQEFSSNDTGYWINLVTVRNAGGGSMSWTAQALTDTGANWLRIEKTSGALPQQPNAANVVRGFMDASGLDPGVYTGRVRVTSPGALHSPQDKLVKLTIGDAGGDRLRLTDITPDGAALIGSGTEVVFKGAVQWTVASRSEALVFLRVYDQNGVLLNPGDPGRTATSNGSDTLPATLRIPASATQVVVKAAMHEKTASGAGTLLRESAPVAYKAAPSDQVLLAGITPDPSQAIPWSSRLSISATARVALAARDRADVVIRGADQNGTALSCESNTGSAARGQTDVPLQIAACALSKTTRQVALRAYVLDPGGSAVLFSSPVVTLNVDVPANAARVTALGTLDSGGRFSPLPPPYDLVSGDQASAQFSGVVARVEYDLVGEDGTLDVIVDALTVSNTGWRGSLVSGIRAPAGVRQEALVPLPAWIVVPREHASWTIRGRLNPKSDPPVVSADASSVTAAIQSIRLLPGTSPTEDTALGDSQQNFHVPLALQVRGGSLKAYVAYSASLTGSGPIDLGPADGQQKTVDFSARVPDDAGSVTVWIEAEGFAAGPWPVQERLASRRLTYDTGGKPVAIDGSAAVSAGWAQVDLQPATVAQPLTIQPKMRAISIGSVMARGPLDCLPINAVWQFGSAVPGDGSFVNNVTFHYWPQDLPQDPDFREDKLQVASWDPAEGKLRWYATAVDTTAHTATAKLDGLAPYYTLAMPGPLSSGALSLPLAGDGYQAAISVINTGSSDTPANTTAYAPSGKPFEGGANPYPGMLPKGKTLSGTPDGIFKTGAAGDGWLQARGPGQSLAGGILVTGGGDVESIGASAAAALLAFTNVEYTDSSSTDLHLANPGSFAASAALELRDVSGALVDTARLWIEPKGKRRAGLTTLFTAIAAPFRGYVIVRADHELAGTALITSGAALAALGAQPPGAAATLYAPHVEFGQGALVTRLNLVNTGSNPADIAVRFIGPDGWEPAPAASLRLDPGAAVQRDLSAMFDFQGQTAAGTLIVQAAPGVIGDVGYSDSQGQARALLPLVAASSGQTFVQFTAATGSFTGFAAFNPAATATGVTVRVFGLDGSQTGAARITLGGNGRHSDLLAKTIPGTAGQAAGYFTVQSDQPVAAAGLLGAASMTALAALEPQPLAAGPGGTTAAASPAGMTMTGIPGIRPAPKPPAIGVSPSSLDFGSVAVGQTKDLALQVTNSGGSPLSVSDASTGNPVFAVASPSVPFSVAPGTSQAVTVRFAPSATGTHTATLRIASNDPNRASVSVALSGTGTGSGISGSSIQVSPASLDFGTVDMGQSASLAITIRNTGDSPLDVLSATSNNTVFTATLSPSTLQPGGSRSVTAVFTPRSEGSQNGRITIYSSDRSKPSVDVPVSGVGQKVIASGVKISAPNPARLDFGDVIAGQTKDLTIAVTGTWRDTPLTIRAVTSDNPKFRCVAPALPVSPAFGAIVTLTIRFSPDGAGRQTGNITIASNAGNVPSLAVPVTGNGVALPQGLVELKIDDGTFETPGSYVSGAGVVYYATRLSPLSYPATLKTIRIYFHDMPNNVPPGTDVGLFWGTTASDNWTIDGTLFTRMQAKVNAIGQFTDYTVPDMTIGSGDFIVGFTVVKTGDMNPVAADTNSPTSRFRSWVSVNGINWVPAEASTLGKGNFGIRAMVLVGTQ